MGAGPGPYAIDWTQTTTGIGLPPLRRLPPPQCAKRAHQAVAAVSGSGIRITITATANETNAMNIAMVEA